MKKVHIKEVLNMPSETFLNLSKEKQEKLLNAAKKEFSKESYANASINQMIKEANISRGSFYMYFKDKKDIYEYLLQQYLGKTYDKMIHTLKKCNGDIFILFEKMFEIATVGCMKKENRDFARQVVENMHTYKDGEQIQHFLKQEQLSEIESLINYQLLDPLVKKHIQLVLAECFHIFMWNLIILLKEEETPKKIKKNFKEQLKLIQNGVSKKGRKRNV